MFVLLYIGDKWSLVSGRFLMEGGFSWKVVPGVTLGARLSGGCCWAHQSVDVYGAPGNLQRGELGMLECAS